MVRAPAAKAGGPGLDPQWLPWVFFTLQAGSVTNVGGMKDLWCLAAINTYEWGEGSMVL